MPTEQRCPCPFPPGGEVICEHDEMPFCIVTKDGKRKAICKRLTQTTSHLELINEVLSVIMQTERPPLLEVKTDDFEILEKEYYETAEYVVNFALTDRVRQSLEYLMDSYNRGYDYDKTTS